MQPKPSVLSRALALFFAVSSLALVCGSSGCEAIVSDTIPGFTCSGTSLSSCPQGEYCKGVGCTACQNTDVCDGYDNDCNGKVDDGPLSDHDDDGFTVCGHTDPSSGRPVDVDCNDNDPNVHPGAKEVCNGVDDDCDGIIDNPDVVCPSGQVCAPQTQECVSTSDACTETSCTSPQVCDPATKKCVDPNAHYDLGHSCGSDQECASGLCAFPNLLGGIAPGAVCSKLCCTSNDCDAGFVCDATGTGGRYCVDATVASRSTPGTGAGGASCSDGKGCRSGLCTNGKCVDTCCSDADCPSGGTACTFQTVANHGGFWCGPPGSGNGGANSVCGNNSSCHSDFCVDIGDPRGGTCIQPCCTSAGNACGSVLGVPLTCIENGLQGSTDTFLSCTGGAGSGNKAFGDACTTNDDCASSNCDTAGSKKCTDTCCSDANCPQGKCHPDGNGALRCVF